MDRRQSAIPLCRHTKTDGHLCGSPAMTCSAFCYHHSRRRPANPSGPGLHPRYRRALNDRESIQQVLVAVIAGIASGDLRPSQAGRMLYALQLALANLDHLSGSGASKSRIYEKVLGILDLEENGSGHVAEAHSLMFRDR